MVGAPMWGLRVRIRRRLPTSGFRPEGWEGVADEVPDWSATIVARWTVPWIDWGSVAAGLVVAAMAVAAAVGGWGQGTAVAALLLGGMALWALWPAARALASLPGRVASTITLDPERLTLETSAPGGTRVVLERGHAGWLVADEVTADWRVRGIALYGEDDRLVASTVGGMARVEVRRSGVPTSRELPTELPIAVLVGAWWPHPARRMTRQGTAGIRLRWRDPGISGFERHERRSRVLWSLLWLVLAAGLAWAALDPPTRDALRIPLAIAAAAVVLWRVWVLSWRPSRLAGG